MEKNICKYCESKVSKIISLRHFFYKCENCKNITRSEIKKINLFDLFKSTSLVKLSNYHKKKSSQFQYYLNVKVNDNYKGEKFYFIEDFIKKDKSIKDVLEVSAGPGLVGYNLQNSLNINYNLTEYDEKIVSNMKKKFNINSYILDFDNLNQNNIPESKKYDLIILYYCIYYCKNLEELIVLLNNKLKQSGKVIITQNVPNFAAVTKFSIMENYPPYVFYDGNYLIKKFSEFGLDVTQYKEKKRKNFISQYFFNFSKLSKSIYSLICISISLYYISLNFFKIKSKDLMLLDYKICFKKNEISK